MNSHDASWMWRNHKFLLRILFLVLFACVAASMVIPNVDLQLLINRFGCTKGIARFFRSVAPGVQIHHVVSFAAVGFVAHIGWRNWRVWHVVLGLYVVAGMTELAQVWVPGRDSSIWHVLLDVAGGLAGFFIAWLVTYAWGDESFREHAQSPAH